jgi:hypothetical protein
MHCLISLAATRLHRHKSYAPSAETVLPMEDGADRLIIGVPMVDTVSIECQDVSGRLTSDYIEIPLHLVPEVLTALMKAARAALPAVPV